MPKSLGARHFSNIMGADAPTALIDPEEGMMEKWLHYDVFLIISSNISNMFDWIFSDKNHIKTHLCELKSLFWENKNKIFISFSLVHWTKENHKKCVWIEPKVPIKNDLFLFLSTIIPKYRYVIY